MDGTSIGLTKKQAYILGATFMLLFLMMTVPCGDDLFMNLPLAIAIHSLTGIGMVPALISTYTIIPVSLLIFGAWLYPGSTVNNLKRKIHEASKVSHRLVYNPFVWIAAAAAILLLWDYYSNGGSSFIQSILSHMGG